MIWVSKPERWLIHWFFSRQNGAAAERQIGLVLSRHNSDIYATEAKFCYLLSVFVGWK